MKEIDKQEVKLKKISIDNEDYFKISNSDIIRPFFMSIVSPSDHWMFIASNGGITAGRKDSENALFPYYTDDKITESTEVTGSKTIFQIKDTSDSMAWEPFSIRNSGQYKVQRNLYKSIYGNSIIFEEINSDLALTFRYQWNSSDQYGFVRTSSITNNTNNAISIAFLDGIQNIMPYGVGSDLQKQSSNLVDAYKRSELDPSSGLGIFALSAIIVDKAEPSEALKCNTVWSLGVENPKYLLSSVQLDNFRKNLPIHVEVDSKAEKGAYFVHADLTLSPGEKKEWMIAADVNKSHAAVAQIINSILHNPQLESSVYADIKKSNRQLVDLVAAADGVQITADHYRDARHFSNALFNIMRGGIFDYNYQIEQWDFKSYIEHANKDVFKLVESTIEELPDTFSLSELRAVAASREDANFKRLCYEYMPLKFSRRHGDPSRPWNRFSINTRSETDGSKILDYEGNWRDIFQNWEALAYSYPHFVESMIHKFLNATTFDGYNPYRITKGGIDWETVEPDNPWSYIGYWGDHQIIYLLKFLEFIEKYDPGNLENLLDKELFVYANVPYQIKEYAEILKNPKDTIRFNEEEDSRIREEMSNSGSDAAVLRNQKGEIHHVTFLEKILATALAKISNLIPEGGIWMNTQRPEWNDANNALVGNGVSMVTLYYLRRFLKFLDQLLKDTQIKDVSVSDELASLFEQVVAGLSKHQNYLEEGIDNQSRKAITDVLGKAGSAYRLRVYHRSFSGDKKKISSQAIKSFIALTQEYLEHSIKANKRDDHLYHAYNLMTVEDTNEISIAHLSEMLEGQVAVLSSGFLSSQDTLTLLDNLKSSALFREDQYSYLLYPNKQLPGFLEKNIIPKEKVRASQLLSKLGQEKNTQIIEQDVNEQFHFNGNFKNSSDLENALDALQKSINSSLLEQDRDLILQIFEEVFNHKAFTGRSGTFYGYEGLGSIYWHMVSKLQLAVQECCLQAINENQSAEIVGKLLEHYYEINEGIGVHKPPQLYGAFPTDPYSHTPAGKGAQQPGMTGQVKEDILCRFGELGIHLENGQLSFRPQLLKQDEFLTKSKSFHYVNVHLQEKEIHLTPGTLSFTFCQVPIIYKITDSESIQITYKDNSTTTIESTTLDLITSTQVFGRSGAIIRLDVSIPSTGLR